MLLSADIPWQNFFGRDQGLPKTRLQALLTAANAPRPQRRELMSVHCS
jgi:hypothetical protein